ncbi:Autophagy-related protein 3 [Diplonema papillatum]|nr:Autophagy-related protein 3 [Diplonema papillatum]
MSDLRDLKHAVGESILEWMAGSTADDVDFQMTGQLSLAQFEEVVVELKNGYGWDIVKQGDGSVFAVWKDARCDKRLEDVRAEVDQINVDDDELAGKEGGTETAGVRAAKAPAPEPTVAALCDDDDDDDDAAAVDTSQRPANERLYDVFICYHNYRKVPTAFFMGYDHQNNPLTRDQMLEDIDVPAYVTPIEKKIGGTALPFMHIHPCRHAEGLKSFAEDRADAAEELKGLPANRIMAAFLNMVQSVIPWVEFKTLSC